MDDIKSMLIAHARSLWRRRWYAALVAWLFCAVGWSYVIWLPNIYEAKARIYVDADTMLRPLLRGIAVGSNLGNQVELMQRTLLSRPNLQKVIHMADLDLAAKTPAQSEALIKDLRHRVAVTGENHNLFTLSYTGPNKDVAAKVVQSLLTVFVESNLGNSRKDMLSARNFIDDQLRDYARQLDAAEKRMADFKAKNIGFLPGESNYNTKLEVAKQELAKTEAELDESRRKRDELQRQLASVPKMVETISAGPMEFGAGPMGFGAGPPIGGPGPGDAVAASDTAARVADLEQKIRALLGNYTEQYPDVVRLKRQLEQAKQQLAEEQAKAKAQAAKAAAQAAEAAQPPTDSQAMRSTAPNPIYEQLTLQLVSAETNIASLEARRQRNEAEVKKWQGLAKNVPEVAAQMAKLNRDYDVIKKAYDELLNRREAARIGTEIETQTQTVQFRIVDPPDAPPTPVGPKRILLLSVVLVAGLGAGGAFAFLLGQIDESVKTVRELRQLVALPVLGAISVATTPARKPKALVRFAGFPAACLVLLSVYAGIITIELLMKPHA